METNIKLLLLKIIKFSGDVNPLVKLGYEYSQVAQLIKVEINDGNAERKNGKLVLTEKGNDLINNLTKNLNRKNSLIWIEPEYESKISKIGINDIFLPNQDELSF